MFHVERAGCATPRWSAGPQAYRQLGIPAGPSSGWTPPQWSSRAGAGSVSLRSSLARTVWGPTVHSRDMQDRCALSAAFGGNPMLRRFVSPGWKLCHVRLDLKEDGLSAPRHTRSPPPRPAYSQHCSVTGSGAASQCRGSRSAQGVLSCDPGSLFTSGRWWPGTGPNRSEFPVLTIAAVPRRRGISRPPGAGSPRFAAA